MYRTLAYFAALLAGATDYSPLVLAVASLVVAVTPALVSLVVVLSNRAAIGRVERQTNGQLSAMQARQDDLHRQIADAQRVIGERSASGGPRQ